MRGSKGASVSQSQDCLGGWNSELRRNYKVTRLITRKTNPSDKFTAGGP